MVHDRPYKTALSHEQALAELRANAGTQFDPDVVNVFCSIYAEGVPPDGLEEVYRLHERARGGLERIDPQAAAAVLTGLERRQAGGARKPTRARRRRVTEPTAGNQRADPRPMREATG
jgi:hypothetical protein